jgi:hypothetical protein
MRPRRPLAAQRVPHQRGGERREHKSLDTLRGYVRRVDLFKEHAGAAFL